MFVDPDPIAQLHMRWMNLEGPTDVMSFPMDTPAIRAIFVTPPIILDVVYVLDLLGKSP